MTQNELVAKAKELMEAPSCCPEAKEAAQAWIDAIGTEGEAAARAALKAECAEDVMSVDDLIAFCSSEAGEAKFGAEIAAQYAAHGKDIKANGGKYCDCGACLAALALAENL